MGTASNAMHSLQGIRQNSGTIKLLLRAWSGTILLLLQVSNDRSDFRSSVPNASSAASGCKNCSEIRQASIYKQ